MELTSSVLVSRHVDPKNQTQVVCKHISASAMEPALQAPDVDFYRTLLVAQCSGTSGNSGSEEEAAVV